MRAEQVPRKFHFIFGLKRQTEPFHLVYYLSLKSCLIVNRPDSICFHCYHEPYGPWWERIKPHLSLSKVEPERFVDETDLYDRHQEGRFIKKHGLDYAHHSDFLRLKILLAEGGVYADIDTLFVRPYPDELFVHPFTVGREKPVRTPEGGVTASLCNALLISQTDSPFARAWLDAMYNRFDGTWNRHSCALAAELARTMPADVHIAPRDYFYHYMWTHADLHRLFETAGEPPDEVLSIHLWSHLWWDRHRTDFLEFCCDDICVGNILATDTVFNRLARRYLPADR